LSVKGVSFFGITGPPKPENGGTMKVRVIPVLIVACVFSQSALAEGLECRRVADPTPRLSCVERPATAEAPSTIQRPEPWSTNDGSRRDSGSSRDSDGYGSRNGR
jgi:hypothetical protein